MFGNPICPKCDQSLMRYDLASIVARDQFAGPSVHAMAICCPHCKAVLGTVVDPYRHTNDIAAQVAKKLGKG